MRLQLGITKAARDHASSLAGSCRDNFGQPPTAPVPPQQPEVSHLDLMMQVVQLTGKVDAIYQLLAEREKGADQTRKDVDVLFERVRKLDNLRAQVVIVGLIFTILFPVISTALQFKLAIPLERQELSR